MIDLHLHTTASDGRLSPALLVSRAAAATLTTISVTDHDTVAGLRDVRAAANRAGIRLVNGIEITAVHAARDVHVLGYFIDPDDARLAEFLTTQRAIRTERVQAIASKLAQLGAPVDIEALVAGQRPGTSIGRPMLAHALVARGHVASVQDAFDRYLGAGQPAYIPRVGQSPAKVVRIIHAAGGIASLAHPGVTRQPEIIEPLVAEGLDAIEAYHSDHDAGTTAFMLELAARLRIMVTGGSDFHGDHDMRRPIGGVTLPADAFAALSSKAETRQREQRRR